MPLEPNSTEDIDDSLEYCYKLFIDVIDKHLLLKTKRVKRIKQPDWMSYEILQCMKKETNTRQIMIL